MKRDDRSTERKDDAPADPARMSAEERAKKLARGDPPHQRTGQAPESGIPLVGNLDSPGAPGSGVQGGAAVDKSGGKRAEPDAKRHK